MLAADGFREVLHFPLWWYTTGLMRTLQWATSSIKGAPTFFGLDVWVKNLFVPMYGDESFVGRLISFGVRFFVVLVRGLVVVLFSFAVLVAAIVYVAILPLMIFMFIAHLMGMLL